jgi:hypothetical protein
MAIAQFFLSAGSDRFAHRAAGTEIETEPSGRRDLSLQDLPSDDAVAITVETASLRGRPIVASGERHQASGAVAVLPPDSALPRATR